MSYLQSKQGKVNYKNIVPVSCHQETGTKHPTMPIPYQYVQLTTKSHSPATVYIRTGASMPTE